MFNVPAQYQSIVRKSAMAAAAVGIPGAFSFGLDVTAMSGIWITMTLAVAKESGHDVDQAFVTKPVAGVASGTAGYIGGSKVATTLLHIIPGAGSMAAMSVNSALDFLYTWRLGSALADLFDRPDFAPSDAARMARNIAGAIGVLPTYGELRSIIRILRGDPDAVTAAL